jgi:abortive infection bacteriophage resistance protein
MTVSYPNQIRNYCTFDDNVYKRAAEGEKQLPIIKSELKNPKSEGQVVEDLFILNVMLDNGVKKEKIADIYPELSKYNDTKSPNIQTFLAGIYRKTKIPDAFGPLVKMLIQNSINPPENAGFDPNEEIGGAILDYIA